MCARAGAQPPARAQDSRSLDGSQAPGIGPGGSGPRTGFLRDPRGGPMAEEGAPCAPLGAGLAFRAERGPWAGLEGAQARCPGGQARSSCPGPPASSRQPGVGWPWLRARPGRAFVCRAEGSAGAPSSSFLPLLPSLPFLSLLPPLLSAPPSSSSSSSPLLLFLLFLPPPPPPFLLPRPLHWGLWDLSMLLFFFTCSFFFLKHVLCVWFFRKASMY